MKVLIIDPWGVNGTAEYLNGLVYGISGYVQLTVVTNFYSSCCDNNADINKWFFKVSERMKDSYIRKFIRGIEYFYTYQKILSLVRHRRFDVIHINWLLSYKIDNLFLHLLKRHCSNLVYTAHNALPHINGNRKINDLRNIYKAVDKIIVHGEAIKSEILAYFPNVSDKIVIQRHGVVLSKIKNMTLKSISFPLMEKCKKYKKIFLIFGAIYPNKGIDRILKIWINNYLQKDALLIIAGKQTTPYPEFEKLESLVESSFNIEIINRYIEDDLMDALFNISVLVLIPYRHASMSGTVFSAAKYAKTVLCTDTGSLSEYLEPGIDSIVCKNSDEELIIALEKAFNIDMDTLIKMGKMLQDNVNKKFNWETIGKHIVQDIYKFGRI